MAIFTSYCDRFFHQTSATEVAEEMRERAYRFEDFRLTSMELVPEGHSVTDGPNYCDCLVFEGSWAGSGFKIVVSEDEIGDEIDERGEQTPLLAIVCDEIASELETLSLERAKV